MPHPKSVSPSVLEALDHWTAEKLLARTPIKCRKTAGFHHPSNRIKFFVSHGIVMWQPFPKNRLATKYRKLTISLHRLHYLEELSSAASL